MHCTVHTTVTPMHTRRSSFSSSSDIFKAHPIYALNRNAPKHVRLRKISNLIFLENLDILRNEMSPEKDRKYLVSISISHTKSTNFDITEELIYQWLK